MDWLSKRLSKLSKENRGGATPRRGSSEEEPNSLSLTLYHAMKEERNRSASDTSRSSVTSSYTFKTILESA